MKSAVDMQDLNVQVEALQHILDGMREQCDEENAAKLDELIAKAQSPYCTVAFCGHFSAGKSTLVNRLCGAELLPSRPTPASANVVSVRYGEAMAFVRVGTEEGKRQEVPLDELEAYCLDGERIRFIDIHHPSPFLRESGLVLLDTPGIDSTDDRHHAATAAALHMCDVVVYVTDYNHVLSELNLSFAAKMKKAGKPLYLVVNQIDKHDESELAFASFCERIRNAFAEWEAEPNGMLVLSLKEPDHPLSEWERMQWLIRELGKRRDVLSREGVRRAALECVREHAAKQIARWDAENGQMIARMEQMDEPEARKRAEQLSVQIAEIDRLPERIASEMMLSVRSLLENANIVPALTRDKVASYLESREPGFKSGWWRARQKTEQERKKREEQLLNELNENVDAHIVYHLQALFEQTFSERAQKADFAIAIDADMLESNRERGAVMSSAYTLRYSQTLAERIRTMFRQAAERQLNECLSDMRREKQSEKEQLEAELADVEAVLQAYDIRRRFQGQIETIRRQWEQQLGDGAAVTTVLPKWKEAPPGVSAEAMSVHAAAQVFDRPHSDQPAKAAALAPADGLLQDDHAGSWREKQAEVVAKLDRALELIGDAPMLADLADTIEEKRDNIANRRTTVALFGAFSAGKSSLVNALVGERVLPVSPHPTTAAVTRVLPPSGSEDHRTADVVFKSRERIEEEVRDAFEALGMEYPGLETALRQIAKLDRSRMSGTAKNRAEFLRAMASGWGDIHSLLGETLRVSFDEFRLYAAEEQKSAFVERIDLYFDSPLSRAGVALVDTPGVNSINARHTGAAFAYLKSADAIVYVTYYNHAFSRADGEFIRQLGQVKDSFEKDKMFFVINAADLAETPEQLDEVVEHVEANLLAYEVRNPRLFPLSSQQALEGKQKRDEALVIRSGIERFEQRFYSFLVEELTDIVVHAAYKEVERAKEALDRWQQLLQQEAEQLQQSKTELERTAARLLERLDEQAKEQDAERVEREARELVFHAKQRILFRFGESFQAAFHPSVLQSSSRVGVQDQLAGAWRELLADVSRQCAQELYAVTLHLEKSIHAWLEDAYRRAVDDITASLPAFAASEFSPPPLKTPPMDEKLPLSQPDEKQLVRLFRTPKHFFEGEGKDQMRGWLESLFMEAVSRFADEQMEKMNAHYSRGWEVQSRNVYVELKKRVQHNVDVYIQSMASDAADLKLQERSEALRKLLL